MNYTTKKEFTITLSSDEAQMVYEALLLAYERLTPSSKGKGRELLEEFDEMVND